MAVQYKELDSSAQELDNTVTGFATHAADTVIHVSLLDRETWDAKQAALTVGVNLDDSVIRYSQNPVTGGGVFDGITAAGFFKVGTEIPRGADLNDYKSFGVFYTGSGANAGDTSHAPINKAGRMEVFPLWGSARLIQKYYTYTNNEPMIYMRGFNGTAWGNWYLFSGTDSGAGIVYTYTLSQSQPPDWSTSYVNYYTKSAGDYGDVYTKVPTGSGAPAWAADTYYSRSSS